MSTSSILQEPVGRLVARDPRVARTFEKFKIDYCCQGRKNLGEACEQVGVSPDDVLAEISVIEGVAPLDEPDWTRVSLTELADHIEEVHHTFLRTELPRLTQLIDKVVNAHGDRHPELVQLRSIFQGMRNELESHMMKEEQVLFPAIRAMETSASPIAFPFGSVDNPIRMMEHEHDDAGNALKAMRELTNDWQPPQDACPTFRVMLSTLEEVEQDLHQHIHKENNILFPRAQELERQKS